MLNRYKCSYICRLVIKEWREFFKKSDWFVILMVSFMYVYINVYFYKSLLYNKKVC